MARKPTHYRLTVNRPLQVAKASFRPGARYRVKAAILDQIKDQDPAAIVSAEPVVAE